MRLLISAKNLNLNVFKIHGVWPETLKKRKRDLIFPRYIFNAHLFKPKDLNKTNHRACENIQIVLERLIWVLKYKSSTISKCCRSVYYNKKIWPSDTEPVQLVFFSDLLFSTSFLCKRHSTF